MNTLHNYFINNFFSPSRMTEKGAGAAKKSRETAEVAGETGLKAPKEIVEERLRKKYVAEIQKAEKILKTKGIKALEQYIAGRYPKVTSLGNSGQEVITRNMIVKEMERMIEAEKRKASKKAALELAGLGRDLGKFKQRYELIKRSKSKYKARALEQLAEEIAGKMKEIGEGNSALMAEYAGLLNRTLEGSRTVKTEVAAAAVSPDEKPAEEPEKAPEKAAEKPRLEVEKRFIVLKKQAKGNWKKLKKLVEDYKEELRKDKSITDEKLRKQLIADLDTMYKQERKDSLRQTIPIPEATISSVRKSLTKEKVETFLKVAEGLGRNYAALRKEFKRILNADAQGGAILIARAMQIALGFKGGEVDGAIGPLTKERLRQFAGLETAPSSAPDIAPGAATPSDAEIADKSTPKTPEQLTSEYNKLLEQAYGFSDYLISKFGGEEAARKVLEERYAVKYDQLQSIIPDTTVNDILNPSSLAVRATGDDVKYIEWVRDFLAKAVREQKTSEKYKKDVSKILQYAKNDVTRKYLQRFRDLVVQSRDFPEYFSLSEKEKRFFAGNAKRIIDGVKTAADRDGNYLVA